MTYALKLTLVPAAVGEEDVDELRARGLDDRALHDVAQVVAYFNYVNRLAEGLGVEVESDAGFYEEALTRGRPAPWYAEEVRRWLEKE